MPHPAEYYINKYEPTREYPNYYTEFNIVQAINDAIKDTINECAELCTETEDRRGEHITMILELLKTI